MLEANIVSRAGFEGEKVDKEVFRHKMENQFLLNGVVKMLFNTFSAKRFRSGDNPPLTHTHTHIRVGN